MKKHFYQLAIGTLALFGVHSSNGQTPCDSAYLVPNYNISEIGAYNYQRCTPNDYELYVSSYAKTPLYFQWKTKAGDYLSEGSIFNEDTLGEFYLEIEGLGCVKPISFTIEETPFLSLDASSLEYCKDDDKPTLYADVYNHNGTSFGFNSYALSKDNKFIADVNGYYELENAEAGTYTLSPINQACWENTQTITITEKDCSPGICEPIKDSVYQTIFDGQIHKSCDLAGWKLTYPGDTIPNGVEIIWKQNGEELSRNHVALSIDVTATSSPDTYSVYTSSESCSWSEEILVIKDSINSEFTSSDSNYYHCSENPLVITAKGNEHLTGVTYSWYKKDEHDTFVLHGEGLTLPNPEAGEFKLYVTTSQNCYSISETFTINEVMCEIFNNCPEIGIQRDHRTHQNYDPYHQNYFVLCHNDDLVLYATNLPIDYKFGGGKLNWYNVSTNTEEHLQSDNYLHVFSPGKYIARYTDENCLSETDTIVVEYGPYIDLTISPKYDNIVLEMNEDTVTICSDQTIKLDPNHYYLSNYEWEKDASFVSNNIAHETDEAGYYTLNVYDNNFCSEGATIVVKVDNNQECVISGLNNRFDQALELAPNPTSSSLTIVGGNDINTVQIVSQLGQTNTVNVTNGTIDLSSYKSGIYTLMIERNGTIETHKIVKQ